jgi:hypothetical protein
LKFDDVVDDTEDRDWKVKQCYLMLIAGVTEADTGVENLWRRGLSGGRHQYANYGQYMPKNQFKAFMSGDALMFCDRKVWFEDNRDKGWEIFMPCLRSFNQKRKCLFGTILLILDESMIVGNPRRPNLVVSQHHF